MYYTLNSIDQFNQKNTHTQRKPNKQTKRSKKQDNEISIETHRWSYYMHECHIDINAKTRKKSHIINNKLSLALNM